MEASADSLALSDDCRVLLVEDNRSDAKLVMTYMRDCRATVQITHCETMAQAAERSGESFDVVVSDLNLPDSQGPQTIAILSALFVGVPLIALTIDDVSGIECVRAGAQDFLPKSELSQSNLKRAVEFAIHRTAQAKAIEFASRHDSLTSLLNRSALDEVVSSTLAASPKSHRYYLMFLDVDRFKEINDNYGHQVGDKVLVDVAEYLRTHVRATDVVGRWGGDEFAAFGRVAPGTDRPQLASRLDHQRIVSTIDGASTQLPIEISYGLAYTFGSSAYEELVASADAEMYKRKNQRRSQLPAQRSIDPTSGQERTADVAHSNG